MPPPGIPHYGATESLPATGSNISNDAQTYTFPSLVRKAFVRLTPATGETIYGRWNASAPASATNWDFYLDDNNLLEVTPDWLGATSVSLFSTGSLTLNTDFTVKGWH